VGKGAPLRRAHHVSATLILMVGTRSPSSGAHSRDPLALPTLPIYDLLSVENKKRRPGWAAF